MWSMLAGQVTTQTQAAVLAYAAQKPSPHSSPEMVAAVAAAANAAANVHKLAAELSPMTRNALGWHKTKEHGAGDGLTSTLQASSVQPSAASRAATTAAVARAAAPASARPFGGVRRGGGGGGFGHVKSELEDAMSFAGSTECSPLADAGRELQQSQLLLMAQQSKVRQAQQAHVASAAQVARQRRQQQQEMLLQQQQQQQQQQEQQQQQQKQQYVHQQQTEQLASQRASNNQDLSPGGSQMDYKMLQMRHLQDTQKQHLHAQHKMQQDQLHTLHAKQVQQVLREMSAEQAQQDAHMAASWTDDSSSSHQGSPAQGPMVVDDQDEAGISPQAQQALQKQPRPLGQKVSHMQGASFGLLPPAQQQKEQGTRSISCPSTKEEQPRAQHFEAARKAQHQAKVLQQLQVELQAQQKAEAMVQAEARKQVQQELAQQSDIERNMQALAQQQMLDRQQSQIQAHQQQQQHAQQQLLLPMHPMLTSERLMAHQQAQRLRQQQQQQQQPVKLEHQHRQQQQQQQEQQHHHYQQPQHHHYQQLQLQQQQHHHHQQQQQQQQQLSATQQGMHLALHPSPLPPRHSTIHDSAKDPAPPISSIAESLIGFTPPVPQRGFAMAQPPPEGDASANDADADAAGLGASMDEVLAFVADAPSHAPVSRTSGRGGGTGRAGGGRGRSDAGKGGKGADDDDDDSKQFSEKLAPEECSELRMLFTKWGKGAPALSADVLAGLLQTHSATSRSRSASKVAPGGENGGAADPGLSPEDGIDFESFVTKYQVRAWIGDQLALTMPLIDSACDCTCD